MAELSLVNKVDLRIALANSDAQLESALNLYLPPVLLKLSSKNSEVRQAVFKIIQNVITRLGASRTILLPFEGLLKQIKHPNVAEDCDVSSVRLYSLLFLGKAVDRMDKELKIAAVPEILGGISQFDADVGARMFRIFTKLIAGWKVPEESKRDDWILKLKSQMSIEDERFVVNKVSKFFMLQVDNGNVTVFPGLSLEDCSFFTKRAGVSFSSPQELFLIKHDLLQFIKIGFSDKEVAIPFLIASTDSSSAINDQADILYRKLNQDLEDSDFINDIIGLFIGNESLGIRPVKPTLQEKILSLLTKSVVATSGPYISQITHLGFTSDYTKLKLTTVQFIKWISSNNTVALEHINKSIGEFNTNMARKLHESILNEGWPKAMVDNRSGQGYTAAVNQRLGQYEALCNVLRTTPQLFLTDLTYIEFLFDSLQGDWIDLGSTIQEGLSSLTIHLPNLSVECKSQLKALAYNYLLVETGDVSNNTSACRYTMLKFINSCLPFEDAEARMFNILGSVNTNRVETIEEALKGLHPHWFKIQQASNTTEFKSTSELLGSTGSVEFPSFDLMVECLRKELLKAEGITSGHPLIYDTLGQAVQFCIQTLIMHAINGKSTVIVVDEEWSVRLEKAMEVDSLVRKCLSECISGMSEDIDMEGDGSSSGSRSNGFIVFLSIIFNGFQGKFNGKAPEITFESTLSNLLSLSPSNVIANLQSIVPSLLKILNERTLSDISLSQVCKIVGIISSHPVNTESDIKSLLMELISADFSRHKTKANLLSLAYLLSRLTLRGRLDIITPSLLKSYCEKLSQSFKEPGSYYIALESVSQLAVYGTLGPVLSIIPDAEDYIKQFLQQIEPKVKKCDERSVLGLAYLSLCAKEKTITGDIGENSLTHFESLVYGTHVSKQIEYLFTSGEAMAILAGGWETKVLSRTKDIQDSNIEYVPNNTDRLPVILDTVLSACGNTKPSLRRAGCIWLLSLVDSCHHLPAIGNNAAKIHVTFMKFLADREELIQESASRGLTLVYEIGDYDLKESLVKGLLKSFTDNSGSNSLISGTVDQDTELFDADVLRTNDGSVSTYRDVLNLASDVGDPSLVYKFMSLAKSSALWSSRKGMAFGLGSILSKTSLDDMLKNNSKLADRLIPKLYRYRYDPNSSVSTSMNDIWNVLVTDSSKTINENFSNILNELLKGMGNKEWRVRQASTVALNDLLNVVTLETYEPRLEEIWQMSFRVMDDIKESVRQAGTKVTKLLALILTRAADKKSRSSAHSHADKLLHKLIPFLLGHKGLLSDADDIRNFALETLLNLIKVADESIKQFIPLLLDNFIGLMSTLEPEVINYLMLNADKYNINNNEIDAKRLQSIGQSPMMDAIEKLIDQLNPDILQETLDVLSNAIKRSVGLPSKVCGSRVLVSLITKKFYLIKPYGEKLMKLAISQITDKNDAISSSYAMAAGYLCKVSSIELIVNYGKKIKKLYFENDDERFRLVAGVASENLSKYSGEKFDSVASEFLPLAFIGQNDINKDVSNIFERQWIENASGSNAIKLYLQEIVEIIGNYQTSNKYEIRQILGKSIAKLTNDINDFTGFSDDIINKIITILIESCKGKSFSGKEVIFGAMIDFAVKLKSYLNNPEHFQQLSDINKVVLVEGKRKNKEYQRHSIRLMGKYLHHFPNDDMMSIYLEVLELIIFDKYDNDDDDYDDDDNMKDVQATSRDSKRFNNSINSKLEEEKLVYIENLFETFNGDHFNTELFELIINLIKQLLTNGFKFEITWRSKVTINECIGRLLEGVDELNEDHLEALFGVWNLLNDTCSRFNNIENVKIKFIRTSKGFIDYLEKYHYLEKVDIVKSSLKKLNSDTSTIIKGELAKVELI